MDKEIEQAKVSRLTPFVPDQSVDLPQFFPGLAVAAHDHSHKKMVRLL